MKIVGITGGIGSGKSSLVQKFSERGVPCFSSDKVARTILESRLSDAIRQTFGKDVFRSDGLLDRKALGQIVFSNPLEMNKLNQLVHPLVQKEFERFVKNNFTEKLLVKEAAILIETGSHKSCDIIVLVTAPKELRIQRVCRRDGLTRLQVLQRMKNQWSDSKKKSFADYIVDASTTKSLELGFDQVYNAVV